MSGSKATPFPDQCCAKCTYGYLVRNAEGQIAFDVRECRERSPHIQYFMMPKAQSGGKIDLNNMQIVEHTGFPKMPSDQSCGRYKMRPVVLRNPEALAAAIEEGADAS